MTAEQKPTKFSVRESAIWYSDGHSGYRVCVVDSTVNAEDVARWLNAGTETAAERDRKYVCAFPQDTSGVSETRARRMVTCYNAVLGIPSEQIERDAKLYPHVGEMHDLIVWFCERVMKGEVRSKRTYAAFMEFLNKLGGDQ